MKNSTYFIVFFILFTCNSQTEKTKSNPFFMADDSELFFNNVRQIYYDLEIPNNTKLKVFRMKNRNQSNKKPVLNLAIVLNWQFDEAYILLEPGDFFEKNKSLEIVWKDGKNKKSGKYTFAAGDKKTHLQFAEIIYQSIVQKHDLFLRKNKQNLPILQENEREVFRKTMVDYYKLTQY